MKDFAARFAALGIPPEKISRLMNSMTQGGLQELDSHSDSLAEKKSAKSRQTLVTEQSLVEELLVVQERFAEEKNKSTEPLINLLPPPIAMICAWNAERENDDQISIDSRTIALRQSFIGEPKVFSAAALADLSPITLSRMSLRKQHRGHYILCRVASRAVARVGITFVARDRNGDAVLTSIYDYPIVSGRFPSNEEADVVFPIGAYFLVREPFVKTAATGNTPILRVDCPTDIRILEFDHPLVKDARWQEAGGYGLYRPSRVSSWHALQEWKGIGNSHFARQDFTSARAAYTKGIQEHASDADVLLLYLNRAQTNLRLTFFSQALQEASLVVDRLLCLDDRQNVLLEKALHRKSLALYSLRKWNTALESFKQLKQLVPATLHAEVHISNCYRRLKEVETGEYDLLGLYEATRDRNVLADVADFVGPVEVNFQEGKGREVVASRDIKPGELLLATKAFAYADADPATVGITTCVNLLTEKTDLTNQSLMRKEVMFRLLDDLDSRSKILDLYAGPDQPQSRSYDLSAGTGRSIEYINPALIDAIPTYNAFSPNNLEDARFLTPGQSGSDTPSALFPANSMVNHSCLFNSFWTCFNDFQLIRAVSPILKGSPVTLSYIPPNDDYATREKRLRPYGIRCSCAICEADLADGLVNLQLRAEIVTDFQAKVSQRNISASSGSVRIKVGLEDYKKLLKKMEATYQTTRAVCRPDLAQFHQHLALLYGFLAHATRSQTPYESGIKDHKSALVEYGLVIKNNAIATPAPRTCNIEVLGSTVQIAASNFAMGRHSEAKKWLKSAQAMHEVSIGGGKELFQRRFGDMLKTLGLNKLL